MEKTRWDVLSARLVQELGPDCYVLDCTITPNTQIEINAANPSKQTELEDIVSNFLQEL